MERRYKVHDKVELQRLASSPRAGRREIYEVIRLMPADSSGEFSYRIRSGFAERAVRESEIRRPSKPEQISGDDAFHR